MNYTGIRIQIKYSTKNYVWLCFKHAAQEAMRGEDVNTDIITPDEKKFYNTADCFFCAMTEAEDEDKIYQWYKKYKEDK